MMTRPAIAAFSLALGVPTLAAPASDDASAVVRIDDLNLASASGRETLDTRIRATARRLCRTDLRGTAEMELERQCVAAALANARPQSERMIAQARGDGGLALLTLHLSR